MKNTTTDQLMEFFKKIQIGRYGFLQAESRPVRLFGTFIRKLANNITKGNFGGAGNHFMAKSGKYISKNVRITVQIGSAGNNVSVLITSFIIGMVAKRWSIVKLLSPSHKEVGFRVANGKAGRMPKLLFRHP